MSSIKFDIGVSTTELDEGLKKANQSFSEFEKTAVQSGKKIDQSYKETGKALGDFASLSVKEMKESVDIQKKYIQDLQQKLKELQNQAQSSSGSKKSGLQDQALGLRKDIIAEQGTQLQMSRELKLAQDAEGESHGSLIGSLGKWAIGLATVGAALQIFKGIIGSTKASQDEFEFATAGAKAGLEEFYRTIATGEWGGFFTNIGNAIKSGYEFAKVMDEIKHMKWAQGMEESDNELEKFVLLTNLRSKTASPEQREADGLKYIAIVKEETKTRVDIAEAEFEGYKKRATDISGIDSDRINKILKQTDKTTKAKAEEYNRDLENIKSIKKQALVTSAPEENARLNQQVQTLENELKKAPEAIKVYSEALRGVGKMKEEFIIGYVNAYKQIGIESASGVKGTLRTSGMITGLTEQMAKEKESEDKDRAAAAKKAKEDAELDNRIKATQELMKTASGARLKQLAGEYIELVKQKNINDQLIDQAIRLARNPDGLTAPALMVGRTISGVTSNLPAPKLAGLQTSTWTKAPLDQATEEETTKELKKQAELRNDILNSAGALTGILVENGWLSQEAGKAISDSLAAFATGDPLAMAIQTASMVASMIPSQAEEFQKKIDKINEALAEQQRLIELSARYGGEESARKGEIADLEKMAALQKAEYERLQKSADKHLDLMGWRQDKADEANKAWKETTNLIEDANIELKDFYTGGTTEITIADAIAQGFQDGKSSAADFADTFNDFMRTAINSSLEEMSKPAIAEYYAKFAEDMKSGGGLSKSEEIDLKSQWDTIISEAAANRKTAYDIAGIDPTSKDAMAAQTGMSGTIARSITEETGTELAGLFRRAADDGRIVRDYTKMGVANLVNIEKNTGETVIQLKLAVVELQSIVTNTKTVYSGKVGG